jgi:geranylgeranylglycerol-phosphate geranylgeranyltransferase
MRPLNSVMTALAVFIGGFIVIGPNPAYFFSLAPLYLAMLSAFLIIGAGNTINDVMDIESDKINRPKRPIPSKKISKRKALAFSIVLFAVGITLSGFVNWITFFIAAFNSAVLVVYSTTLQNKVLLGNIAVSYLVGSAFLFGGAAVMDLKLPLLLMLLASLANMSREIVKDLEDIEGDRLGFLKNIALNMKSAAASRFGVGSDGRLRVRYGKHTLINIAMVSLALAIIVSPIPFLLNILGWLYLIIVIPTDIVFIVCIYLLAGARKKRHFSWLSKLIKIGMLLGLLAFIAGGLF